MNRPLKSQVIHNFNCKSNNIKLSHFTNKSFNLNEYKTLTSPAFQNLQSSRLITAIKTPYLKNGKIDIFSFDEHVEKQINHGVDGFIIGGTTGEGHLFSWDEHIMLIAHTKDKFGDKCIIIGNTGSNSTKEAVNATEQGFAVGMDASLQINPYYGKTSENGVIKHFSKVLDFGPTIIYNVPSRTGQDISVNLMNKLSWHPNFCGVKECMGEDRIQYYSNKGIITWSGNDDECHDTRHYKGCNGVISVTSNVIPGLFRKMMDNPSPEIRDKTIKLVNYLFIHPNPIGINTLMSMLGLCEPVFRLPYIQYNKDMRIRLKNLVDEIGIEHFISRDGKCNVLEDYEFYHIC